jgi:hypothetical protein
MISSMNEERAQESENAAEREAERAGDLFTHYLRRATEAAGGQWDAGNEGEIRDAIGRITEAARLIAHAVVLRESVFRAPDGAV